MGYSAYVLFKTNAEAERMTRFMREQIRPTVDIVPFANSKVTFHLAANDELGYCNNRRALGFNFSALMQINYFAMYSYLAWMAFHSLCRRNVCEKKVPYFWYDGSELTFILPKDHYAKVRGYNPYGFYHIGDEDTNYILSNDSYFRLIWERMTIEYPDDVAGLLMDFGKVPELIKIMEEGKEIDFEPWKQAKQFTDESIAAIRKELKRLSDQWNKEFVNE